MIGSGVAGNEELSGKELSQGYPEIIYTHELICMYTHHLTPFEFSTL